MTARRQMRLPPGAAGRLDRALADALGVGRAAVKAAFQQGRVRAGGRRARGSDPAPTLFQIHWGHAEGLVLVAGKNIPVCQAVLMVGEVFDDSHTALDQILTWEETQCNLTVHHGDIKNQAWLELHLNILLEWYCQSILNHYQQLTGAVMVRSIFQSLSVLAETRGWNLSTQDQHIRDTSIFQTAAETGRAYREMLSVIRSRIEPIIGSSLTRNLIKQSIEPTRGIYKSIQETFSLMEEVQ